MTSHNELSASDLTAIFDACPTTAAREQEAWRLVIPAIENLQVETVKLIMPSLNARDTDRAFCWNLRVNNSSDELGPKELEIARVLAPAAQQEVKDNLLYNQASWVKIYIDLGDYGNAGLFLDRVAANVAAGGNPDYLDPEGLFTSVSALADQLDRRGYPQLSEAFSFGKELAVMWSGSAGKIPQSGYEKIYEGLQGQSKNLSHALMEFTA